MRTMKSVLFKTLGILLSLSMLFAVSAVSVFAEDDAYPSKPVNLIIPTSPGGSVDTVGRLIANKLSERLGQKVVPENLGGAGGIIGTKKVAKADPDGYTLLIISASYTIQPALRKLPFDPMKDLTPIAKVASASNVLAVHPSVPANSVKELIALAKQKPGQLIFVASGVGSSNHMVTERFKMMADIDIKILQFKGGTPAKVDLLGGHSQAWLGSIMSTIPHIRAGKLRALGTSGSKRSPILPDVPTIAEAALPGFEAASWWGFVAPRGTPAPIVNRLNKEIKTIMTLDDVKKQILNSGGEVDYLSSTEFGTFIGQEITNWVQVVKKANIKVKK